MKDGQSGAPVLQNKPVLVMAYKNRALDHFVLLCESFCQLNSIVRIGHVSKDNEDKLKPILLRERVMSALPREETVLYHTTLTSQYERCLYMYHTRALPL